MLVVRQGGGTYLAESKPRACLLQVIEARLMLGEPRIRDLIGKRTHIETSRSPSWRPSARAEQACARRKRRGFQAMADAGAKATPVWARFPSARPYERTRGLRRHQ